MVYECERNDGVAVGRDLEEKRNEIGMVRNDFFCLCELDLYFEFYLFGRRLRGRLPA